MDTHRPLAGDGSTAEPLTRDTVFSVLSNERRRLLLRRLRDVPDGSTIGELSRQLAAWENDVAVDDVTYRQRKRVYTSLHQTHLPKLAADGVVDYDRDRGTVVLTERATALDDYLSPRHNVSETPAVPWPRVYLAVATVGVLATLVAAAGLFPPAVSDLFVAGFLAVVVAAVAGVHSYVAGSGSTAPGNGER